jgi:hypothetical protein
VVDKTVLPVSLTASSNGNSASSPTGNVKTKSAVVLLTQHGGHIGHESTLQDKRGWNNAVTNIILDVGFAVKVKDVCESAFAGQRDVDQRREDEPLDSGFLARIRDILAMVNFSVERHGLSEIGDQKDDTGPLHGRRGGFFGGHVGLPGTNITLRT